VSECLSIGFIAAANGISWIPERDFLLTAMGANNKTIVSTDPKMDLLTWAGGDQNGRLNKSFVAAIPALGFQNFDSAVPIEGGRTYFVSTGGAGYVHFYLDEVT
jgi:hypothetical protein